LWNNGTAITTTTFSGATANYAISVILPASSSVTLTVTAGFNANANNGTFAFSVTGATGTNGQPVNFNPSPLAVTGATVTVTQATSTPTNTYSATFTATNSPTLTPTYTMTATPINTPTATPTEMFVTASSGTPLGSSTQLSGANNVLVQQVVLTNNNPSAVTMTGLPLTVTGSGLPANITSVSLLANGSITIAAASVNGSTAIFSFNSVLPASSSVTYTVTANFGTNASGTYAFTATGGSANGQQVQFNGFPVVGATITVVHPTVTPTFSPTFTITSTPQPIANAVIYPNPSNGGPVSVMPPTYSGTADVKVQLFTIAFRKVQDKTYNSLPYGPVQVAMEDSWGNPLASGLYYVVVTIDGSQRSIAKLLLLR
jgi:hypothetical protein